MREYIEQQINEIHSSKKGQIDEKFDPRAILGKLRDFVVNKDAKVNKEFAKIVASKFEGDFAKYLQKYLIKNGKDLNTLETITLYSQVKNDETYDKLFKIIGIPMLRYFVQKTFGKTGLKDKINSINPFMKKVSTGNSSLDNYIYTALYKSLQDVETQNTFKVKLHQTIDSKMDDIFSDKDYWELLASIQGELDDDEDGEVEQIDEYGKRIKATAKKIRNMFISNEDKYRHQILDDILDIFPNLKKPIKREIKEKFFGNERSGVDKIPWNDIEHLLDSIDVNLIVNIVVEPIMEHVIKNSQAIYFKLESFKDFVEIVKKVFMQDEVLNNVKTNLQTYVAVSLRELEDKRKAEKAKASKSAKTKYKRKTNKI